MRKIPTICPSCEAGMHVRNIRCEACGTEITGDYDFPLITRMSEPYQEFITQFVLSSGSLKEMAKQLKVSYPTVRNHLDEIIEQIHKLQEEDGNE